MHHPSVVVGGTLAALEYAWQSGSPVIYCKSKPPVGFGDTSQEDTKRWEWLCFNLSLGGLLPFVSKATAMRITDKGIIVTAGNQQYSVLCDKTYIYDDEDVRGLPVPVGKTTDMHEVFDWMNVRSGMSHEHDTLSSSSDFVKWVSFYPSERIDGNHNKKDLVAISYMPEAQLQDPKYSEIYAKFKVLYLMREAGIKGQSAGRGKNYSLKVEPSFRQVRWIGKNKYEDTDRIKFL